MNKVELLNELAADVAETLVLDEVLAKVVQRTLAITGARRGFVLLDEGRGDATRLVVKAALDADGKALDGVDISLSTCQQVYRTREAAIVADALDDGGAGASASILALDLRTVMCVPLLAKGNAFGVLYVDSDAVVEFTAEDLAFLNAAARHAANAIANARLLTATSQLVNRLRLINELAAKVNESLVLDDVLRAIVLHMLRITRAQRGFLLLGDDALNLEVRATLAADGQLVGTKLGISLSTCIDVFRSKRPMTVVGGQEEDVTVSMAALDLRTVMCVPLVAKGKAFGVLYVDADAVVDFGPEDLDLLEMFARHASNGIENALLHSQLSRIAEALRAGKQPQP